MGGCRRHQPRWHYCEDRPRAGLSPTGSASGNRLQAPVTINMATIINRNLIRIVVSMKTIPNAEDDDGGRDL